MRQCTSATDRRTDRWTDLLSITVHFVALKLRRAIKYQHTKILLKTVHVIIEISCFLARSANVHHHLRNLFLFFFFLNFFNDFSEINYPKIHWTDFRNLYIE